MKETKVITAGGSTHRTLENILPEFAAAIKDGWSLSENPREGIWAKGAPNLKVRITLSREVEDTNTTSETVPNLLTTGESGEVVAENEPQVDIGDVKVSVDFSLQEVVASTTESLETLAALTRKVPMLKLAEDLGIEVPDDIKHPPAIKKFLKERIATKG